MSVDVEPRAGPATRRLLGYGVVGRASLLFGTIGTIPFVLLGYAVVQWVLAPLGLAAADTGCDDPVTRLLFTGVLLPLTVLGCRAGMVWSLTRRFALACRWASPLALAALAVPFVLFAISKSS